MKRITILLISAMLCIPAFHSIAQSGKFVIEGYVPSVPDSTELILYLFQGNVGRGVGRTMVIDGRFRLEGEGNTIPQRYSVAATLPGNQMIPGSCYIWITDNHTKITGDSILLSAWRAENDLPEQIEHNAYADASRDLMVRRNLNTLEMYRIRQAGNEALKPRYDSLDKACDALMKQVCFNNLRVMAGRPVSGIMIEELLSAAKFYAKDNPEVHSLVSAQYARLSAEQKASIEGQSIATALNPPKELKPGDMAPDGQLYDHNGGLHTLAGFRGKYLLLDFWSTGCGPCIMAGPEMKEIAEKHSDQLTIASISLDIDKVWKEYKGEVAGMNLSDGKGTDAGFAALYSITGIPNYILISPQGSIVDIWMGYGQGSLYSKLRENKVIE